MAVGIFSQVRRSWIVAGAGVLVAVAAYFGWRAVYPREGTDDAQVSAHVSPVAPRVSGMIHAVHARDNQVVKAGDVLVELEARDYELAVQRAEADLAAAEAAARAARTDVPVTSANARSEQHVTEAGTTNAEAAIRAADRQVEASEAKVAAAQARLAQVTANANRAAQDLKRLEPLMAKEEISRQQFDAATATEQVARATVASANADVREAEANLKADEARRVQTAGALTQAQAQASAAATAPQQIAATQAQAAAAEAQVLQAKAALEQAKLNLERTMLRAPAGGIVSRRTAEVGQVAQVGQPLMSITSLDDVWVVANFKETQLDGMRIGQRASVEVDAFGGEDFPGHVDSIAAATGAIFSLLPPDNATGNFVKVVQRVPVKILLDAKQTPAAVLRPGMSVTATVYLALIRTRGRIED